MVLVQGVPPICWQLRTKFWKLKNHICQKVSPFLKSLNKNLSDGILKPGKIKLKVFLNWISKKVWNSKKKNSSLPPPPTTFHHHPLAISLGGGGGRWWEEGAGKIFFFGIWHFFFIFILKILPIWFSQVSKCHLKAFFPRILKQGLLFDICDFSIFKI